jgi:hypothetical protein
VEPETRYARSGDVSIAYQVTGDGPFDVVLVPAFVSHVELAWQVPGLAAYIERLGSFCRLIRFDKRGTGMSDRVSGAPSLETRMDDVRGVREVGLEVRAGLHSGECELVDGSGIAFTDRGDAELKGIPGAWRLFAVDSVSVA